MEERRPSVVLKEGSGIYHGLALLAGAFRWLRRPFRVAAGALVRRVGDGVVAVLVGARVDVVRRVGVGDRRLVVSRLADGALPRQDQRAGDVRVEQTGRVLVHVPEHVERGREVVRVCVRLRVEERGPLRLQLVLDGLLRRQPVVDGRLDVERLDLLLHLVHVVLRDGHVARRDRRRLWNGQDGRVLDRVLLDVAERGLRSGEVLTRDRQRLVRRRRRRIGLLVRWNGAQEHYDALARPADQRNE